MSLVQPGAAGSVPRVCVPFSPVPQSSVPRVGPPPPPPPEERLPVMEVCRLRPDSTGNVDLTEFVGSAVSAGVARIVDGAPEAFDTLRELAAYMADGTVAGGIAARLAALESGKADKAVPAAAGNLASLDSSGNLADSGATPASIARAAAAAVVANAPETLDTLEEIADLLGSDQVAGTVLKRISDLETGKVSAEPGKGLSSNDYTTAEKVKLAGIAKGATAVTVTAPSTSSAAGKAADAKAVGDALWTGFTEWEFSGSAYDSANTYSCHAFLYQGGYCYQLDIDGEYADEDTSVIYQSDDALSASFSNGGIIATRHLITPTKTSQLTNDGPSSGPNMGHPFATTNQIPAPVDISGKLDGAAAYPAWEEREYDSGSVVSYNGRLWRADEDMLVDQVPDDSPAWSRVTIGALKQDALSLKNYAVPLYPTPKQLLLNSMNSHVGVMIGGTKYVLPQSEKVAGQLLLKANSADVATALAQKAGTDALPYAMVTPGEWAITPNTINGGTVSASYEELDEDYYAWCFRLSNEDPDVVPYAATSDTNANSLHITTDVDGTSITATRASLPGHLLDRAVNAVSVSSATGITLPNKIAGGKSRDFYVRLSVSAESAVTFAATDSGGDAVAWDSMGNPSATLAVGTYLYRLTEVADGVFHAADITSGGSIDPAVLDEKLDASSAAPAFSESLTYLVGEYVTYGGVLYRCKTAVTVAGAWTGTSNWEADDMTSPDATLDIMSDGRLRVVTVAGEDLWMQGYDLESTSAQVLKCEKVNLLKFAATTAEAFDSTSAYAVGDSVVYGGMVYKFTAAHSVGDWVGTDAAVDFVSLTMPYVPVGKVGDFVLDVDNSANASVKMVAELSGLFAAFDVFVDKGRNLSDILTFDGGEQCELYFTMTAFGTQAKPAWKVVKQVVEKQEAGS